MSASDVATARKKSTSSLAINAVHNGDCIELLERVAPGTVDLAFADPPFNIGYTYDVYDDKRSAEEYLDWSKRWIQAVAKSLKDHGTFWLAIGDEFAAELKLIAQNDAGLHCRSWVIWYYTFGVNCKQGFSRSHTHLFHFVKDQKDFVFNYENPVVRIPSARQLVYGDTRANPNGRLPDNTWILRPQDVPEGFRPDHDVWYFPRVAGTFKEREGFHGCQMPEQLLGRIIRLCSNPGDLVLDPFSGSGTTLVTAKKLGRNWLGTELSEDYAAHVSRRLNAAHPGDELDGFEDPLQSAPGTSKGKRLKTVGRGKSKKTVRESMAATMQGVVDAFRETHQQLTVDQLLAQPEANHRFVKACKKLKLDGDAARWNQALLSVRKSGKLPKSQNRTPSPFTTAQVDTCSDAAEVAWQFTATEYTSSLDGILCHPRLAETFDGLAAKLAPGFEPFRYRWAALVLRKRSRAAARLAESTFADWSSHRLPAAKSLDRDFSSHDESSGVYVLLDHQNQTLYVGETLNLAERLARIKGNAFWSDLGACKVRVIPEANKPWGLQAALVARLEPRLNLRVKKNS